MKINCFCIFCVGVLHDKFFLRKAQYRGQFMVIQVRQFLASNYALCWQWRWHFSLRRHVHFTIASNTAFVLRPTYRHDVSSFKTRSVKNGYSCWPNGVIRISFGKLRIFRYFFQFISKWAFSHHHVVIQTSWNWELVNKVFFCLWSLKQIFAQRFQMLSMLMLVFRKSLSFKLDTFCNKKLCWSR